MRSLDRSIKANKTSHWHLLAALKYRKTEPGCDDSLNLALNSAADEKTRKYIQREWVATKHLWANYKRIYSCLLLQVTTTNTVESWHNSLKKSAGSTQKRHLWSLQGCSIHIHEKSTQSDARAEKKCQ